MLNKQPTVINPQIPGEQPPADTPVPLREYLSRMFRYCSQSLRQIFEWQRFHLQLTPPDYAEDPHSQYWHKMNDAAYAGLFFQNLDNPKTVNQGAVISDYSDELPYQYGIDASPVTGTFTLSGEQRGLYIIGMSGYASGNQNEAYVITVYINGAPSIMRAPMVLRGLNDFALFSSSLLTFLDTGYIDVRLESPVGESIELYDLAIYLYRVLPSGVGSPAPTQVLPVPQPIPPGWGLPP